MTVFDIIVISAKNVYLVFVNLLILQVFFINICVNNSACVELLDYNI